MIGIGDIAATDVVAVDPIVVGVSFFVVVFLHKTDSL